MGNKKSNHLHRYKRTNLATYGKPEFLVFKCTQPACNHYIRVDLAEGKLCECPRCNEPMILTRAAMQLVIPHCVNCTKRKKPVDVDTINEFLNRNEI